MKKKKYLLFIIIPLIVVALIIFVIAIIPKGDGKSAISVDSITLAPSTLQSKISSTGVVDCTVSKNVYGTLTYPVKSINVEVGDKVEAGAVLCQLDTYDLEYDIAKQQATLDSSNKSAQNKIESDQANYNIAKSNLDNGLNSSLISANSSLANAKVSLDNALKNYQNAKSNLDNNLNTQILTGTASVTSASNAMAEAARKYDEANSAISSGENSSIKAAQISLDNADDDVSDAKDDLDNAQTDAAEDLAEDKLNSAKRARTNAKAALKTAEETAQNELDSLKAANESAQAAYDNAVSMLEATRISVNQELEQLLAAYENAKVSYESIATGKQAAEGAAQQELSTYINSVESSKISADNTVNQTTLEQLQAKLKDCTVTAPVAGTVTAVYATEGSAPNGIMFIIEDTDSLKIKAKVKEYDIGSIAENMKVLIESDATGDAEYEGYISKIAPTAIKDSTNASTTAGTQFEVEVTVKSAETKLLIGMNARLSIIIDEKENAYGVRFDAIETDEDGTESIFIAKDNGDETYTVEKIPVTAGIETDFEIEVNGDGITDGTIVITDIDKVKAGSIVRLTK